jgi:hypothetical protein
MHQPKENVGLPNACFVFATVYAGQMDRGPASAGFIDINPCPVKASEIIDNCYHELLRKVSFKVKALETLYRIRSRMSFRERIA